MNVSLTTLVGGVQSIHNEDGFPLESNPPQGEVIVTFTDGTEESVRANMTEYEDALEVLESRDD